VSYFGFDYDGQDLLASGPHELILQTMNSKVSTLRLTEPTSLERMNCWMLTMYQGHPHLIECRNPVSVARHDIKCIAFLLVASIEARHGKINTSVFFATPPPYLFVSGWIPIQNFCSAGG
jgi:hypothetical protein